MFRTCVTRFDVTENVENFLVFRSTRCMTGMTHVTASHRREQVQVSVCCISKRRKGPRSVETMSSSPLVCSVRLRASPIVWPRAEHVVQTCSSPFITRVILCVRKQEVPRVTSEPIP